MLPSVADDDVVGRQILAYAVVVWALSVAFAPIADMGLLYTVAAVVLGGVFTGQCLRLKADPTPAKAMALFHGSITYVSLLFGVMAIDPLLSW
jgi:protoheme IX farnesyltransferase